MRAALGDSLHDDSLRERLHRRPLGLFRSRRESGQPARQREGEPGRGVEGPSPTLRITVGADDAAVHASSGSFRPTSDDRRSASTGARRARAQVRRDLTRTVGGRKDRQRGRGHYSILEELPRRGRMKHGICG